eukprot:577727-Lingulodinium_polyedra.AAC.1
MPLTGTSSAAAASGAGRFLAPIARQRPRMQGPGGTEPKCLRKVLRLCLCALFAVGVCKLCCCWCASLCPVC